MGRPEGACRELTDLIGEYAGGDVAELTPDERARVEAHLAACAPCRKSLEEYRAVLAPFEAIRQTPVPESLILVSRPKMLAFIRSKARELYLAADRRRQRRADLTRFAVAAAAALVFAAGLCRLVLHPTGVQSRPNGPMPQASARKVVPVKVSSPAQLGKGNPVHEQAACVTIPEVSGQAGVLDSGTKMRYGEKTTNSVKDPKQTLCLLDDRFAKAKALGHPAPGTFEGIIAGARSLISTWQDSDQAIKALLLISRCYTELAEPKKAMEAFLDYAGALGTKQETAAMRNRVPKAEAQEEGRAVVGNTLFFEAARLLSEGDPLPGLSYCDAILTRFPDSEVALRTRVLVAQYDMRIHQPKQAVATLQALVRENPQSSAARTARSLLPTALAQAGRRDGAVQAWIEYAEHATSDDMRANGYLNAGVILRTRGKPFYPDAIRMLNKVVEEFAETPHVQDAKRHIEEMQKEIEREVLKP